MLYLDADVFFLLDMEKKGLCADFLVHAAGPENLMIIFFGLNILSGCFGSSKYVFFLVFCILSCFVWFMRHTDTHMHSIYTQTHTLHIQQATENLLLWHCWCYAYISIEKEKQNKKNKKISVLTSKLNRLYTICCTGWHSSSAGRASAL